ncbi:MAG: cupredoxin domain-containing protein [Armatimonadetes bacterium]|nr:cupredoxin domain-containing protein [Armatimonadota bacterium]
MAACAAIIGAAAFTAGTLNAEAKAAKDPPKVQTAQVTVTADGYEPSTLNLKKDVRAKITFTRKVDSECASEVVFPDYKVRKKLPLNKPVVVEFTPKAGTFKFTCGMGMYKGKLVVK